MTGECVKTENCGDGSTFYVVDGTIHAKHCYMIPASDVLCGYDPVERYAPVDIRVTTGDGEDNFPVSVTCYEPWCSKNSKTKDTHEQSLFQKFFARLSHSN